jgi:DNA-binding CsgD family transcriptional regulator/tetratricopeptide (TPR) repeat protein
VQVTNVLCPVMVGRQPELGALRALLSAAVAGAGGLVAVTGEPGIGKTRLVREAAEYARAEGLTVVTGRAVPSGASEPYRPLTEALLQALRHRVLPDHADLKPWLPALGSIVPSVHAGGPRDDSPAVRGEAVLRLLHRLADPAALLVVLEDLHWADPDTLSVLEYLAGNLSDERILCLATSRSEPPSAALELIRRLSARPGVTRLPLARLDDEQVIAMVRACLPGAADGVMGRVLGAAEGVPFLVEEVLGSPGVPGSFADTVKARLTGLDDQERLVLSAAAVFGRHFDWRVLGAATGLPAGVVADALEKGVASLLLTADGDRFRFRHTLTRDTIVEWLLPPRHAVLARDVLAAVEAAHPHLPGRWRDIAADLAARSGDRERASVLLAASGRESLDRGALVTAVDTFRRSIGLLDDGDQRIQVEALLVEALALAGRVDEATEVGDRLIARFGAGNVGAAQRAEVHLRLAQAAVAATRWPMAAERLRIARDLLAAQPQPVLHARVAVLEAEVAFANDDIETARRRAEAVLASGSAPAEIRCHALELLGRVLRIHDLNAARDAFDRALSTADGAQLRIWRIRALHELGTIEMFDHAGTRHLVAARRAATELGALSTVAILDVQLTATCIFGFALDDAAGHAEAALDMSERLGLSHTRAITLVFLGEIYALRREPAAMEHFLTLAGAAAPGDPEIEGSAWAGARAMIALLGDDRDTALAALDRGIRILSAGHQQSPAPYRGMWPLLLACAGDRRAAAESEKARRSGVTVNRANRGLLGYADAVLAGRRGEGQRAADVARAADAELVHYPVWADLARLRAAECAIADGWGEPGRWLHDAGESFAAHGLDTLATGSRQLAGGSRPSRWAQLGITAREADVLGLIAEGLPNKEIAVRLHLSVRTVEKHVESLLRRTGTRSRTQLVAVTGPRPG